MVVGCTPSLDTLFDDRISELFEDVPDIVKLPYETWIFAWPEEGAGYGLHSRQGKIFIVATANLSGLTQEQNAMFLALYTAQQVEKIELLIQVWFLIF